jgi:hypothetical protein
VATRKLPDYNCSLSSEKSKNKHQNKQQKHYNVATSIIWLGNADLLIKSIEIFQETKLSYIKEYEEGLVKKLSIGLE